MLIPNVPMEKFVSEYGFRRCKDYIPKIGRQANQTYYLCLNDGCTMLFVSPEVFYVNKWDDRDPRLHSRPAHRKNITATDLVYDMIKRDFLTVTGGGDSFEGVDLWTTTQK